MIILVATKRIVHWHKKKRSSALLKVGVSSAMSARNIKIANDFHPIIIVKRDAATSQGVKMIMTVYLMTSAFLQKVYTEHVVGE